MSANIRAHFIAGEPYEYREVWEPRVFLGVWEECKTFEEAEPAGKALSGCDLGAFVLLHNQGGSLESFAKHDVSNGYWVRRKPDAANDDTARLYAAAIKQLGAANQRADELEGLLAQYTDTLGERVKRLEGLLDEALRSLDYHNVGHANSIRERRAGK